MNRIRFILMFFLFVLLLCSPQYGYCAEKTPEQFVKDFYTWYITTDEGRELAIKNDGIYQYIARETVEKVKKTPYVYGSDRRDYFLKMFDYPLNMSGVTISVGKVTDMGAGTFVVPVAIATTFPDGYHTLDHVVVILEKIDGALKITKCVDIYPEA